MAEKEDLDPFASIIDQCKYSSSQEDLLRYCFFCRESQEGLLAFSGQESFLPEEELQAASQGLIICSAPDTQPEEEDEVLQVTSQGLIICSAPDTQPEEEEEEGEEEEEELQRASQGLIICSAPDTLPEEDFQTPEERLLLVSSEEQWMDLDENVESKIDGGDDDDTDVVDGDTDVVDGDVIGSGFLDLDDTVDLGNDSFVNFSEENSVAGNGSPMPRGVRVDGDDNSPDTQLEEEDEELQVASQGLIICSAPDTQPVEDFQTPEERLLLVSSEEQWMDLDENVESKTDGGDGDTDVFDGNGSPMPRAVRVDGGDTSVPIVEKSPEGKVPIEILPLQECLGITEPMSEGLGLPKPMTEGLGLPEPMMTEGLGVPEPMSEGLERLEPLNKGLGLPKPMTEGLRLPEPMMTEGLGVPEPMGEGLERLEPLNKGLGLPEVMSEGLDDTLSKNLIASEMKFEMFVVDNVDSSVGRKNSEICLGGVVEKTIESPVEKKLGSLKSRCNSPSMSSPKSLQKSQKISTHENVDDVNAHSDMYFKKDDMLVVHPVTNEVEVLEIAVRNNSGVPMCCMDAVMEDVTPIAIEKGLVPEISTDKVLDLDNPQTDVVRNDEGKRGSYNMEGLGEVKKVGSSDIPPQSEDPPELRRLPNWVRGKDNAMGSLRQSRKRRVGKADCYNRRGINKVGEVEGSGCGGGRVVEVDGIGCGAGRVEEVNGIDTGRKLREGTGLGHGGKKTARKAGCSSAVTEALSSGKEYDAMMNLLAATFLRENDRNAGSGRGGGRVEEVGGSDNDGRKLGEGKGSGSHGNETARVTGTGHGGGRVEEVDGSDSAETRLGKGKGLSSHGKKTTRRKGSDFGGGIVKEVDGSANAGRRSGEEKGSGSHGKKTAGEAEGSSRLTSALSSGNQSQAMMNFLTSSFLREPNVNKENDSHENSQNTEDILEIAIRAGLKFPRPRWWKPEGYETKRYN